MRARGPYVRTRARSNKLNILVMVAAVAVTVTAKPGFFSRDDDEQSICDNHFCVCRPADHPLSTVVTCEFDFQTNMDIFKDRSLAHVTDIEITGAHFVTVEHHAFYYAHELRRIVFRNCSGVHFMPRSIIDISSANLRIELIKIDHVAFERSTYATNRRQLHYGTTTEAPVPAMMYAGVSLLLEQCHEVLMAGQVFSVLQDITVSVVSNLRLSEGALQLDPKAIVSHHGPELVIEFNDVTLAEVPRHTFATSAARVTLRNVRANVVQPGAFSATAISQLNILNCQFSVIKSNAFEGGGYIENFVIAHTTLGDIEPRAFNGGVNFFTIMESWAHSVSERGIDVSAWNLQFSGNNINNCSKQCIKVSLFNNVSIIDNKFVESDPDALNLIPNTVADSSDLIMTGNNFSTYPIIQNFSINVKAEENTFGLCHCIMGSSWMSSLHMGKNYCFGSVLNCTNVGNDINLKKVLVKDFLPTCKKGFIHENCKNKSSNILNHTTSGASINKFDVFVVPPLLTTLAVFFTLLIYFCMFGRSKYKVCCNNAKRTCRGLFLIPLCFGRSNCETEEVGSISQVPIPHSYTEMQCLNSNRNEFITLPIEYSEVLTVDKATQSLPEELTKEFLEGLKKKLDDPASYEEAKAVVDHLYELVKAEETCNADIRDEEENIYDLPIPPLEKRIIRKDRECASVGTDAPSLDRLLPMSPYDGQTNLCQDYFEPKDLAVHVYAEISNYARSAKGNVLNSAVPDVLVGQAMPRGPFLRAMQHKRAAEPTATIRSTGSVSSNVSANMMNRPLPAQPSAPLLFDPREGSSR